MENYENDLLQPEQEPKVEPQAEIEFRPEPEHTEQYIPPVSQPYSGQGVGRRESPFADSPYVMNRRAEPAAPQRPNPSDYRCGSTYVPPIPPQYPPVKPKKQKKEGSGVWKKILCAVLALAVIAGSCGITAALVNNRWENRMNRFQDSMETRLTLMQDQIDAAARAAADAATGNSVSGTQAIGNGLTPGQVYARNVQSVVLISCTVESW